MYVSLYIISLDTSIYSLKKNHAGCIFGVIPKFVLDNLLESRLFGV